MDGTGGCQVTLLLDNRSFWESVGLKLGWFTLAMVTITLLTILVSSVLVTVDVVNPLAEAFWAIDCMIKLVHPDWRDPLHFKPNGSDSMDMGSCESMLLASRARAQHFQMSIQTLHDDLLHIERRFRVPMLKYRRAIRAVQHATRSRSDVRSAAMTIAQKVDSGELTVRDVVEFQPDIVKLVAESALCPEWCSRHNVEKCLGVIEQALRQLAVTMQVEVATNSPGNSPGDLTLGEAQQAIMLLLQTIHDKLGKLDLSEAELKVLQKMVCLLGAKPTDRHHSPLSPAGSPERLEKERSTDYASDDQQPMSEDTVVSPIKALSRMLSAGVEFQKEELLVTLQQGSGEGALDILAGKLGGLVGLRDGDHIHKLLAAVRGAAGEGQIEALLSADGDKLGGLMADGDHIHKLLAAVRGVAGEGQIEALLSAGADLGNNLTDVASHAILLAQKDSEILQLRKANQLLLRFNELKSTP